MRKIVTSLMVLFSVFMFTACPADPAEDPGFDISVLYGTWQSVYTQGSATTTYRWTFAEGVYGEYYAMDDPGVNLERDTTGSMSSVDETVTLVKNTISYNSDFVDVFNNTDAASIYGYTFDLLPDTAYNWAQVRTELAEVYRSSWELDGTPISLTEAQTLVDEDRTQVFTFTVEGDTLTVNEDGEIYVLTRI